MTNRLYYGDNLGILREHIADASVDLIYLDPPFNSNASYNVLFKAPDGAESQAQIEAFEDTWHWNETAEDAYWQVLHGPNTEAARMLEAMRGFLGDNDMMAYLAMMAVRLIELHRVLKPTGSLYLHCDPTASHYLKILLDAVFGVRGFSNEIAWRRTTPKGLAFSRFASNHDILLLYRKSGEFVWNAQYMAYSGEYLQRYNLIDETTGRRFQATSLLNPNPNRPNLTYEFGGHKKVWRWTRERMLQAEKEGRIYFPPSGGVPREKRFLDEQEGVPVSSIWTDIPAVNAVAQERLGYPTQKPVALLERIISASSNEGDVVLDPFCGCGTTVHAAQKLGRQWIGIDVTHLAISLIERRLTEAFPGIKFETYGVPTTIAAARNLAERDKHEFEKWAVSLIPDAQPWKGGQKGADTGIDGIVYLRTGKSKTDKAIIEVKGGGVSVDQVHKLKSVIEREKALMGLFLTLKPPTKPMVSEAASAGFVEVDLGTGSMRFPRLQLVTIEDLLNGIRPRMPIIDSTAFRKAKREVADTQEKMNL